MSPEPPSDERIYGPKPVSYYNPKRWPRFPETRFHPGYAFLTTHRALPVASHKSDTNCRCTRLHHGSCTGSNPVVGLSPRQPGVSPPTHHPDRRVPTADFSPAMAANGSIPTPYQHPPTGSRAPNTTPEPTTFFKNTRTRRRHASSCTRTRTRSPHPRERRSSLATADTQAPSLAGTGSNPVGVTPHT